MKPAPHAMSASARGLLIVLSLLWGGSFFFAAIALRELPPSDLGTEGLAQLAILAAALTYSFASLYGRRFKGLPPTVIACGQVTCSTFLLIPLVLLIGHPFELAMPGLATWAALISIAILSTALAYILYFKIQAIAGVTNLMLVTFLIPVSALIFGAFFLDETISQPQLVGLALIMAGLALIDSRLLPAGWVTGPRHQRVASDSSSTTKQSMSEEG